MKIPRLKYKYIDALREARQWINLLGSIKKYL